MNVMKITVLCFSGSSGTGTKRLEVYEDGMEKAHWIHRTHFFRNDEYECSSCRYITDKPYKVCPNCNASMRGSKYDPFDMDEIEILDEIIGD